MPGPHDSKAARVRIAPSSAGPFVSIGFTRNANFVDASEKGSEIKGRICALKLEARMEDATSPTLAEAAWAAASNHAEPYATVTFEDVSIPGLRRIVCRVALNVTAIPRIWEIRDAADMAVASEECRGYAERTVLLYLPGIATDGLAFAVAEYELSRLTDLRLQPASAIRTQWEAPLHGGLAF